MVMVRSIIIPRISKRWSNPHNILDIKDSNTSRQNTTLAGEQVVFIMWTSSRWKEVKGVVDDNKNHRGQGVFLIMNIVDISEEVKVLKVIWHICREVSRGCNQTTTATSKEMTKWQVIGSIYKMQARNQSCLSRQATWCWKLDISRADTLKNSCTREGRGSTVKDSKTRMQPIV